MAGVCVVGGGVIGSLYAGHLAQVADVSVLTRRAEHAEALERDGLRITGKSDLTARVAAAADAAALPDADLVILATKATEVEAAAERLAGRMPGATVMTIQNGLGAEELVGAARRLAAHLGGHVHERLPRTRTRTSSTSSTRRPGSGRSARRSTA